MLIKQLPKLFIPLTVLSLSLACGPFEGSSKSVTTASSENIDVSGTLDFSTGLSKSRQAVGDGTLEAGEVQLKNIATGVITEVAFTGSSFSASVPAGDYIITAQNSSSRQIRKILPSVTSSSSSAGTLDLDSTVISEMVEKFKVQSEGKTSLSELSNLSQSISDMDTLYQQSDDVLSSSTGYDESTRQMSLLAMAIRGRIKRDINSGIEIASDFYNFDDSTISDNFDEAVQDMISDFSAIEVVLSESSIFTSSTTITSSDFNHITVSNVIKNIGNFSGTPVTKNEVAVFSTVASDFSSSATASIDGSSFTASQTIKSFGTSDMIVRSFGKFFYAIKRFNSDSIERYDITDPSINLYPTAYSTKLETESTSTNPHDLIFQGMTKAYLTRYGSNTQWIVNPIATAESDFKVSTIDLSAYDDGDGTPEISQGIIVGKKLFLGAQRLDRNNGWQNTNTSYVIVIDTATNTEIDTGKGSGSIKGIPLPAKTPISFQYFAETGLIYINCQGQFGSSFSNTPRKFNGGIVTLNPTTYETKLLVDDGDDADAATTATGTHGGLFSSSYVVSSSKGYITTYAAWQNLSIKTFNPSTGVVGSSLAAFDGKDIRGINLDSQKRLWISTSEGIYVLNTADDSIIKSQIDLGLIPGSAAQFVRY